MRFSCVLLALCLQAAAQTSTTTASVSPNPVGVGQPTTFTANVTPSSASGSVAFVEGHTILATAPIEGSQAIAPHRFSLPGRHSVRAVRAASASAAVQVNVPSTPPVNFGKARSVVPPRSVLAGGWRFLDLNRDGREDAVFVDISGAPGRLYVHLGTGDPAKPLSDSIDTQLPSIASVEFGDVNGDGFPDLAVTLGTSSVSFWLGDGAGHFAPSSIAITDTHQVHVSASLDANADGLPDFLLGRDLERSTVLAVSTGPAAWNIVPVFTWPANVFGDVTPADVNGDQRTDFVVVSNVGCRALLQSSAGLFSAAPQDWFQCGGPTFPVVKLTDLNNDGRDDIVYAPTLSGVSWQARLASPTGVFGDPVVSLWTEPVPERERLIDVADWDGDGLEDLISAAFPVKAAAALRIWKGNGTGAFTFFSEYRTFALELSTGQYRFVDWNADGVVDLLTHTGHLLAWEIGVSNLPPDVLATGTDRNRLEVGTTFTFNTSLNDPNGDLQSVRVLLNSTPSETGGCQFRYDRTTGLVQLDGSGLPPGPEGQERESSQCRVRVGTNVSSTSANIIAAITPYSPLIGVQKIFVRGIDQLGLDTGWLERGWLEVVAGAPAPPVFTSVTPMSGSAEFQIITATVTDANQAADIRNVLLLIADSVNGAGACLIHFDVWQNRAQLFNDAGSAYLVPMPGLTSNSQCTINQDQIHVTNTQNSVTVSVPVAFAARFHGAHKLFVNAVQPSGAIGWTERGAFIVNSASATSGPGTRSLTPESVTGMAATLTAEFTHADPDQHYIGYIFAMPSPSPVAFSAVNSCILEYNRISNSIRMINDAGTGWSEPVLVGSMTGRVSNSQCRVDSAAVAARISGEIMTVTAEIALKAPHRRIATFAQALDASGRYSGIRQFGSWSGPLLIPRPGPFLSSAATASTPAAGSETVVSFAFGHSNPSLLAFATVLIGDGIGNPGCQIFYFPQAQPGARIQLVNDAGTALLVGAPSASNSRCSVDASTLTLTDKGTDGQLLGVRVKFNAANFAGRKRLYSLAVSSDGLITHWEPGDFYTIR